MIILIVISSFDSNFSKVMEDDKINDVKRLV